MPAKPGARAHHAVLQLGADLVAVAVERRQAVAGELGGLLEHRVDRVVGRVLVARQRRDLLAGRPLRAARNACRRAGRYKSCDFLRCRNMPRSVAFGHRLGYFQRIMTDTVLLAIDGPRATITLNDPAKHNRLDPAGLGKLRAGDREGRRRSRRAGHGADRRRREDLLLGLRPGLDPVGQGRRGRRRKRTRTASRR